MDAKLKTKWIDALVSGDYEQGRERLRTIEDNRYCCLGVLCDIVNPEGWDSTVGDGVVYGYKGDVKSGLLPVPLLQEVELSDAQQRELANMNDNGMDFLDIALYIEENL